MLRMKHKPPFSCSFLTLDLLLIYVFLDLKKKNETTEATFFYLATLFLPTSFLIHLSGKTVKGRKDGGFPRLNSDVLMRMFLSSNYPVLKVPTITIAVITEASARCHTRFPPTGQRWSLELLVICHVEGSGNVPGPFQIVAMKLQWHDKTVAGEPAVNPWRSVSVLFFFFSIGPLLFSFFFLCLSSSLLQAHVEFSPLLSSSVLLILSSIISGLWQNCFWLQSCVLPGVASLI